MTLGKPHWGARLATAVGLSLAALTLLLGPAVPALAHAVLVSSSPGAQAVLPSAPSEVVLTFSEPVRKVPGKIRVLGPDGSRVDRGEPTFKGAVVTIRVDPSGPRGTYLVSYRVISADSHPVPGGFTYSVGAPSAAPVDTGVGDRTEPAVANAVKVVRYVGYLGLLLLVGPALVLSLLWPRRLSRRAPTRLAGTGAALVAVATLAELWLQVPYTAGGGLASVTGDGLRDVLGSPYGTSHLVRLALLVAGVLVLRPLLAGRGGRADRIIVTILGVALLVTWPISGHPAASPVPAVSVVVDVVHLGAMAVWLGGLVALVGFLLRQADERELAAILPVWSRWAALAVSTLLLAGTVQALVEVTTPEQLLDTGYGRLLLGKVGLFVLVLAVAAYSRRVVRRGTASLRPRAFRWAILAELGITAVVLALSATLVQTTPARTAGSEDGAGGRSALYSTTLTSDLYSLQVEIDPAQRGSNSVHLYAYTRDNKPLPVVEWSGRASLPSAGIEPIQIPLLPLTDNHAYGDVDLSAPGDWQVRFTVRTSDIDQATVTAIVPIR